MKSIPKMLVQWDTLKMKDPKGRQNSYAEKLLFIKDQRNVLIELSRAGCVHIPGEPLPVSEMLAERKKLIAQWE